MQNYFSAFSVEIPKCQMKRGISHLSSACTLVVLSSSTGPQNPILIFGMNLLPKSDFDFAQAEYWNKFFKQRGKKDFDWYGEFNELFLLLQKYLKTQDSILMVGCGNSTLSLDLYDYGYRKITNIDISTVVISQMKKKVGNQKAEMVFQQMDVLDMSFEKETFSVVIDKGTLDALMPSNREKDIERAEKLFSEINRVLKDNGRYIIVSLLQEHILEVILNYFSKCGWLVRILRCWDVEKNYILKNGCLTLPVFMIVCIKFRNLLEKNNMFFEIDLFLDGKSQRLTSKEEVMAIVKEVQRIILYNRESKGEMELVFFKKEEKKPRYTIYIIDETKDFRKLLKYAAFIVPHGRETEWMFGTEGGRKHLRESCGYDRLAVVIFHRDQNYGSLTEVQDELRQYLLQLAPPFMNLTLEACNIPYLSMGDEIGHRVSVYSGSSKLSGDLLVEDVEIENEIYRRLIFMNNQFAIQSEVKIKNKSQQNEITETELNDSSYIASSRIFFMSIPAALITNATDKSVAVIGVGGGSLCVFLRDLFPSVTITGIEIDPLVLELAHKYFGMKIDDRLKVQVKDGVEFLKEKNKFDIIMLDVDSKEQSSALRCPPASFLEHSVLASVAESLGEKGVFVINAVSRVDYELKQLNKKIQKHFNLLCWYNLKEDLNRIIYASNAKGKSKSEWQREVKEGAVAILNSSNMKKIKFDEDLIDLDHFNARLMT